MQKKRDDEFCVAFLFVLVEYVSKVYCDAVDGMDVWCSFIYIHLLLQ